MKYKGVYQQSTFDCGVACLLSIIKHYKGNNTFENIRYLTKCDNNGVTALNLINASKKLGFKSRGIKCELKGLEKIKLPAICHLVLEKNYNHYVVIYKLDKSIYVFDPAKGNIKYKKEDFIKVWSKIVIELIPLRKLDVIENSNNFIIDYIKSNILTFIIIFIFSIISIGLAIICNYYFKTLLDYKNSLNIFIIFSIFIIFKEIINYICNIIIIKLDSRVDKKLYIDTHNKLLSLPYYYFNSRTSGDIITKFNDLEYIKELIIKLPITLLINSLLIILSSIILININLKLFLIFIFICIIYFFIIIIFNKKIKYRVINNQESNAEKNMIMVENIKSVNTIKNMNLEEYKCNSFNNIYDKYLVNKKEYEKIIIIQNLIKNIILLLGINLILYYGINLISISDLILFNSLMLYFIEPLNELSELSLIYKNGINAFKRINEIYNIKNNSNKDKNINNYNISIKNLNYSYDGYEYILKNKNIEIKEKDKIVVVGPSGSGKSTLFKLINKTYEVDKNMIFIDNVDINNINVNNYITYVSQEETLFNDTLYNNLIFNNNNSNLEEIIKLTHLDKVMKKRKLSLNSIINEDGLNLSKGERQKIILTRVLLKNNKIIILDEALNGIEENEEKSILKSIINRFNNSTIIYITHTESCIKIFDKIIKFKEV